MQGQSPKIKHPALPAEPPERSSLKQRGCLLAAPACAPSRATSLFLSSTPAFSESITPRLRRLLMPRPRTAPARPNAAPRLRGQRPNTGDAGWGKVGSRTSNSSRSTSASTATLSARPADVPKAQAGCLAGPRAGQTETLGGGRRGGVLTARRTCRPSERGPAASAPCSPQTRCRPAVRSTERASVGLDRLFQADARRIGHGGARLRSSNALVPAARAATAWHTAPHLQHLHERGQAVGHAALHRLAGGVEHLQQRANNGLDLRACRRTWVGLGGRPTCQPGCRCARWVRAGRMQYRSASGRYGTGSSCPMRRTPSRQSAVARSHAGQCSPAPRRPCASAALLPQSVQAASPRGKFMQDAGRPRQRRRLLAGLQACSP